MGLLTEEHRAWIGTTEPPVTVEVTRRDIQKYAAATEQQQDRYRRGDEAPPMFVFNLFSTIPALADLRTDGLAATTTPGPPLPLPRIMAGGTELQIHRAIRAGDTLTGVRTLTDLYEKEGRTGPLIFLERVLRITTAAGEPVLDERQTAIAR
ncbi:MAG: MaoC family dehydratase N-terminal domain-containing protein [Actinomycetota bacterium]